MSRARRDDLELPGEIDYLAKDYASFRQVMLERMAAHVPEWTERNPADLGVAIVEVLAYAADYLSYYQDAVATEAYLDTARRRESVRRHLRLLGHFLHEGCNTRTWVQIEVSGRDSVRLPAGTALLTRAGDLPTVLLEGSPELAAARGQGGLTFETMHEQRLWPRHNRMPLHSAGADGPTVPRGATAVTLAGHFPQLEAGDVVILECESAPEAGDADARLRHAARLASKPRLSTDQRAAVPITELEFFAGDALPFTLAAPGDGDAAAPAELVARANVVLADHGRREEEDLPPPLRGEPYRPALTFTEVTRREPFDPSAARGIAAAAALPQRPERALPDVGLFEGATAPRGSEPAPWLPRRDLLESQPFAAEFVAETGDDGEVRLRFGDGRQGRRPAPGARFVASYRVGNGPTGHIGHDSLAHVVGVAELPIVGVRNPLPAAGGAAPELLESARLIAPRAFRRTESCVTAADLERLAGSYPGVLSARAEARWTGSWETWFLFVQRPGGAVLTPELEEGLRVLLEPRLLAGTDLELRDPTPAPLEIRLRAVLDPGAVTAATRAVLLERLGCDTLDDDDQGYFHSDRFTFGQPVYLDGVLDEAMGVEGVVSVEPEVFRPLGSVGGERVRSSIEPGPFEIVTLRNDPGAPELGVLTVELEGGS
jgi:hypothetical protein